MPAFVSGGGGVSGKAPLRKKFLSWNMKDEYAFAGGIYWSTESS